MSVNMTATPDEAPLTLDQQLCFSLYATSRLLTRAYQPLLEPMGITYPQYIVLMILWEEAPCPVSRICQRALLNTNTLTPLLKRLEQLGYVSRQRRAGDERVVEIGLTAAGAALQAQCRCIPAELLKGAGMPLENLQALKAQLDELLRAMLAQEAAGGDPA